MPKVKRLNKIIHPNSRNALKLAAKEHHKCKLIRSKEDTKNKSHTFMRKLLWFKNNMDASSESAVQQQEHDADEMSEAPAQAEKKLSFTNQDVHWLIDLYFHRFDDELEQIATKRAIGKRTNGQNFSREKSIEMTLQAEKNEYETSGLVVPDLTNADTVKLLRAWNGQASLVPTFKLKTIKKTSC